MAEIGAFSSSVNKKRVGACIIFASALLAMKITPLLFSLMIPVSAHAAVWETIWTGDQTAPTVEISPLKYGKTWAYAVEIDDQPVSTVTVAKPLLANYFYSDAPPGVAGGKARPFVGTAALYLLKLDTGNPTVLNGEQLKELRAGGWGFANHSYWHTGNHWDKTKALSPADFRRELFWSQVLWPVLVGEGRAATHFVFPNGDPNYGPYLKEFGLHSGSRVGGKAGKLPGEAAGWLDFTRGYLDEGVWAKEGVVLKDFPKDDALAGRVVIDFTHGIEADPNSANHTRWQKRLEHIAKTWGRDGDDSLWNAPTDEIVAYDLASKSAKITAEKGKIRVELPDEMPGSALTLHFKNWNPAAKLAVPNGATFYQKGAEAWLTTPVIGKVGANSPSPHLERIYSGKVKTVTLEEPRKIAGVRVLQRGGAKADFALSLELVGAAGTTNLVPPEKAVLGAQWGTWHLFSTWPDREAIAASEVRVNADASLKAMEVWALAE